MSAENVELVRSIQPPPDVDLIQLFMRDDPPEVVEAALASPAPALADDFESVFHRVSSEPRQGVRGLREGWVEWLAPWASYRTEIDEVIDVGERVLVRTRDYARPRDIHAEVEMHGTAVYTVRDGKIVRAEFFPQPEDGLRAVGLAPSE
jgi:ketosteroid isomerase-like protein